MSQIFKPWALKIVKICIIAAFDSIGTLSHLTIDLSHNKLQSLRTNRTTSYPTSSNIMSLDLASNNISWVEVAFFHPVQNVLKTLNLSRNALTDINPESLGHIRKLHSIDLSHNLLITIEQGTFFASKKACSPCPAYAIVNKQLTFSKM